MTFFDGKEKETSTELRTFSKKRWNIGTCFVIDVKYLAVTMTIFRPVVKGNLKK